MIELNDPNVLEVTTCTFSNDDNKLKAGILFMVSESDAPYEIIISRDELKYMLDCIDKNEIY